MFEQFISQFFVNGDLSLLVVVGLRREAGIIGGGDDSVKVGGFHFLDNSSFNNALCHLVLVDDHLVYFSLEMDDL